MGQLGSQVVGHSHVRRAGGVAGGARVSWRIMNVIKGVEGVGLGAANAGAPSCGPVLRGAPRLVVRQGVAGRN